MNFESDSDIERYFELRNSGRQGDALTLYNTRLRRKYPDEAQRTLLMRYYRSHDQRYHEILRDNMVNLAERAVSRTTSIIALLTKDIDAVDMTDAYSVIKLAEGLLSVISPDRYTAIAFTEKYVRYAKILDFRHAQMERTAELIRLYVTDTIESVQELKKEHEEKKRQNARALSHQKRTASGFDLSRITFNPADIAKILIPPTITRTEDIVIAYCIRYWNLFSDMAFEKTIFLYSRKYKTQHHEIFQAIKNGRMHGWKDEEILNAVLANVVTGYYYNISGDLYLQRAWTRYKLSAQGQVAIAAIPGGNLVTAGVPPVPKKARKARKSGKILNAREAATRSDTLHPATRTKTVKPVTPFKPQKETVRKNKPVLPASPAFVPNSIADIIRKKTGKTYTVYKELFFRGIRPSIRTVLASASDKKGDIFGNRQNDAEEIIYNFLFEHYNDPYQNWKESGDRKKVEDRGYVLPEIEPVIEKWILENR